MTGDSLFKLAVASRRERDPAHFENYFFDSSIVYVYVSASGSELDQVTNLTHELGHALLAETPLGFTHQALFYLASAIAEKLWNTCLVPAFKRHLPQSSRTVERATELRAFEAEGSRRPELQRNAVAEADELLRLSAPDIRESLSTPENRSLASAFLDIQERRHLIGQSARLCHEAVATDYELGVAGSALDRFAEIYSYWFKGKPAPAREEIKAFLTTRQSTLHGIWKDAFALAGQLRTTSDDDDVVRIAAHAAHHFPYASCELLDMPLAELKRWLCTPLLSPDERFKVICQNPGQLKRRTLQENFGRPLLESLMKDVDHRLPDPACEDFMTWIQKRVFGSSLCKSLQGIVKEPTHAERRFRFNWHRQLRSIPNERLMPPIVASDGSVRAPSKEIAISVQDDFARAHRVHSVERAVRRVD
jgi:hypothetical protein